MSQKFTTHNKCDRCGFEQDSDGIRPEGWLTLREDLSFDDFDVCPSCRTSYEQWKASSTTDCSARDHFLKDGLLYHAHNGEPCRRD